MKSRLVRQYRSWKCSTCRTRLSRKPPDAVIRGLVDRDLRLRPAPVRRARRLPEAGRHPRPRAHGCRRRGRTPAVRTLEAATGSSSRSTSPAGTAGCASAAVRPVRDDPGPRAGQGRGAVRLHRAVRLGTRRAGRVPARAAGPVRADQGPRGPPDDRFLYLSDVLPTAWQAVGTRTSRAAALWPCSVSGPSARCARGSALTGPAGSSAWIGARTAGAGRAPAWRPSTWASSTTSPRRSAR